MKLQFSCGKTSAVLSLDAGLDAKVLQKVVSEIKKAVPAMSFVLVSGDLNTDSTHASELSVMAVVAPGASSGLHANSWLAATLSAVGGKGGGSTSYAVGKVSGAQIELLVKAAESHIQN